MSSLEERIAGIVAAGVEDALAPYLRRLGEPEPITYSVPQAAIVLGTSPHMVRRLIADGNLPVIPHMGDRRLIPRHAVHGLVEQT